MSVLELIVAGLVILGVAMVIRHRRENKPVDMNHQAPNVHNVQMKGKVGPATAADKPAPKAAAKKPAAKKTAAAPKKKVAKKTTKKKTTKKTSTKK
jgi:negative regulator of sigma E activity